MFAKFHLFDWNGINSLVMLQVRELAWSTCRALIARVLSNRPTPRHIGFIMDGNRRYAQKYGMMTSKGHSEGYSALLDCLQWCQELGVSFVSVYAFSIDNYKRTAEEVDTLMNLAEEKLIELSREEEKLGKKGICVKVLGDLSLAPAAVQAAAERVMQATKNNSSCTLNICFSYTYVHDFCNDASMTISSPGIV